MKSIPTLHSEPQRVKLEFECSNCHRFFDVKLNINLNGNYRVHCPLCEHVHYRKIIDGKITATRFPENDSKILIEDIMPMPSSCKESREEKTEDVQIDNASAFMRRLWHEKFSAVT